MCVDAPHGCARLKHGLPLRSSYSLKKYIYHLKCGALDREATMWHSIRSGYCEICGKTSASKIIRDFLLYGHLPRWRNKRNAEFDYQNWKLTFIHFRYNAPYNAKQILPDIHLFDIYVLLFQNTHTASQEKGIPNSKSWCCLNFKHSLVFSLCLFCSLHAMGYSCS